MILTLLKTVRSFKIFVIFFVISIILISSEFSQNLHVVLSTQNPEDHRLISSQYQSEGNDLSKDELDNNAITNSTTILIDSIRDGSNTNNTGKSKNVIAQYPLLSIQNSGTFEGQAYSPEILEVTKGEVITITNTDYNPHTVTSDVNQFDESKHLFDTGVMLPGNKTSIDTKNLVTGKYPYHCEIHLFMKGLLIVT